MTSRMVGSVLTLVTLLFSVADVAAQTYTQMQWGMNKGVTPYAFGANINGTWSNLGTVSATGVWGLNPGSILVQPTAATPSSIYSAIFPGVTFSDTVQSVRDITAGTTQENNAAIAAYVKNASGGSPSSGGNGIGIFAAIQSVANNSPVWGINTLCQDAPTRAVSILTGNYCIGAELDFNIMSAATQVIGVSVGGNSLTQPTTSNAYLVNPLSQTFGYKWGAGFTSLSGATDVGVSVGAKSASGSNIESQDIQLGWRDGSGSPQVMVMKMTGGYLSFVNTSAWNGIALGGNLTVQSPYTSTFGGAATFNSGITVGVAGTTIGSVAFKNATSGTITLQPTTGALGTVTATLPANTGTIAETNMAQTFSGVQTFSSGFGVANLAVSAAAPTIGSGFGTSPSLTANNGTAAFRINVGTGGTATNGVVGLPTAANGWNCFASDITTPGTGHAIKQSAGTTTSVTLTNYNSAGTATAWAASDIIIVNCMAY